MKRIAIITATLLLISSVCFGQMRTPRITTPPSPITGNATDGYSLGGSLTIPYTFSSPDARTGISVFQLAATKNFSAAEMDGKTYYLTGNSPAYTVRFPTFTAAAGYGINLIDGRPDGGVTVWDSGTSIWYGVGAQGGTGSTVWVNAGSSSSGWTIQAFPTIRNGVVVLRLLAPDITWNVLP